MVVLLVLGNEVRGCSDGDIIVVVLVCVAAAFNVDFLLLPRK